MNNRATLVVTTVNDPQVLERYYENFRQYGHLDQVDVLVIPDKKTDKKAFDRCKDLKKRGLKIRIPSMDEQEGFLKNVGFLPHLVPFNSDNRRNIGYLMALESGTEFLISIDDDNYCLSDTDFFVCHQVVCEPETSGTIVNTSTAWFNVCSLLKMDPPGRTYPRGFPYRMRHLSESVTKDRGKAAVRINAGLWLQDPDIDGISWLVNPVHSVGMQGESVILGERAWSPISSQNTALHRSTIPAYYFIRMGYPLAGFPIDRYGDIFSGYFVQACVRHLGQAVRFGTPLADHRRNSHNYMNDAANECACIMAMEDLLPWLTKDADIEGNTCAEAYTSLSYAMEEIVERFSGRIWTDATRGYFHQMGYYMREWVNACCVVSGG